MTNEQRMTIKYCDGFWKGEYEEEGVKKEIRLIIGPSKLVITHLEDGNVVSEDKPSSSWHWAGETYLWYIATTYFIRAANETHLIFGEFNNAVRIGDRKWEFQFDRVAHF